MAVDTSLSERKLTILKAIIQNYLETGEPVGSRTLSKYGFAMITIMWGIIFVLR